MTQSGPLFDVVSDPPLDVDREKFVTGKGSYGNVPTYTAFHDAEVFRIDPAPTPWVSLTAMVLVFAAALGGVYWLLTTVQPPVSPFMLYGLPIGMFLFLASLHFGIYGYIFADARAKGPWLVVWKKSGQVELPRLGLKFDRREIERLEYLSTKGLETTSDGYQRATELVLVTLQGCVQQRHHVVGCNGLFGGLENLVEPLIRETGLPVVRIVDEWFGWNVTEQPYPLPKKAAEEHD